MTESRLSSIDNMLFEERENALSLGLIKNLLFVCPKCLAVSINHKDICEVCIFCQKNHEFHIDFYELVWDSFYYGWHYRITYEKQLNDFNNLKFKPLLQNPSYDQLFFATLILFDSLKIQNSVINSMSENMMFVKEKFPDTRIPQMKEPELNLLKEYLSNYFLKNKLA